ncbi:lysosome-associated membrane glycoprotein 1-like [Branchiostoma floridae]|uniref:Lysosome-associated membrane glycoprotein 1-like n=1 Tax=Branchiostoma floridae TaxID=7739 RepID=A0A9J7L699_BRAFL|nr:lysosome-associated membrane glycoprotein 1-like [Branchiostoma floridae]
MFHTSMTAVILLLSCCWMSVALAADDASFDDPEVGHFAVSSSSGKKCLLLDIAARFSVQYVKSDNTTAEVSYALPIDSVATGTCASTLGKKADISLGFFTGYPNFGIKMEFERDILAVRPRFWLSALTVYHTLDPSIFPDAKYVNQTTPNQIDDMHEFETSTSKSYLCKANATFNLGYPVTQPLAFVIDYIKVQPFDVHKQEFSASEECPQDHGLSTLPAESTTAPVTTPTPRGIPVGNFSLKNDQGEVCLLASWGVRFNIEYETQDSGTGTAQFVLPVDSNVAGACEDNFATLSLNFDNGFDLTAIFQSNGKKFDIANVALIYKESLPHFPSSKHPNKTTTVSAKGLNLFLVDVGKSYLCKSKQSLEINANVTLEIIDWQVQPFAVKNGTFGDAMECALDGMTTIIPISNATTILPTNHTTINPTNHTHTVGPSTNQTTPGPTNHTHTPLPPSTTHIPTPGPPPGEPKQGHYQLKDKTQVCLLADMGLQFTASYTKKNKHTGKGVFNVPVRASASGTCGDEQSSLTLTFYAEGQFNVTFDFHKSAKGGGKTKYHVASISLTYTEIPSIFPGSMTPNKAHTVSNSSLTVFPADQDRSYKCDADVHVMITKDVDLLVRQVHVQPFGVKKGQFSSAEECSQDSKGGPSYGLEIGLGVGLAVILVGLGVFWYIRRRAAKKYRKMESVLGPE